MSLKSIFGNETKNGQKRCLFKILKIGVGDHYWDPNFELTHRTFS